MHTSSNDRHVLGDGPTPVSSVELATQERSPDAYVWDGQALVGLSIKYILDANRREPFHCKTANTCVFLYLCWANLFSHLAAFN